MHQLKRQILLATTAIAWWGCAAVAQAQTPPAPPMGCPAVQGSMPGHATYKMRHAMQRQQTQLKAALKLSPEQEPAWTQFTQSMQPALHTPRAHDDWSQLTTPQRIEKMKALKTEHDTVMDQHLSALATFYAALTPDQQKTFDQHHSVTGMKPMGTKHRQRQVPTPNPAPPAP